MKIMYHAEGTNRKALADAISRITGVRKVYKGIPSYAYEIEVRPAAHCLNDLRTLFILPSLSAE